MRIFGEGVARKSLLAATLAIGGGQLGTWTEAQAQVPSSARPGMRSCAERSGLRSEHSREPTRLTFVNKSGVYRALVWIGFKGEFKDYGGLNSGEQKTIDTFRTHPWMITDGPGNCVQIILPAAEPATVTLR
jgi:hypothetical protein